MRIYRRIRALAIVTTASAFAIIATAGCRPNTANIALRKENQALKDRITSLERQHTADIASMAAMRGEPNTTEPAIVNPDRLPLLFTTTDLKIGRLTGPATFDSGKPGLKVQISPQDDTGDVIKASGTMIVEATDPEHSPEPLLGRWVFEPADLKDKWISSMFVYAYILSCPWEGTPPAVKSVRVKVRFVDFLTGRALGPVDRVVQMDGR
jgi:hypothetical protein